MSNPRNENRIPVLSKQTVQQRLKALTLLVVLAVTPICFSCENIDLGKDTGDDGETGNTTTTLSAPSSTGEGTADAPYTVGQLKEGCDTLLGCQVWVIGYAVGEAYQNLSNAVFEAPFSHGSNLLLGATSNCTDVSRCTPIELTSTSTKASLSLMNNPTRLHNCVMIHGTVSTYLRTTGLRSVSRYQWLGTFTIPDSGPTNWDETKLQ